MNGWRLRERAVALLGLLAALLTMAATAQGQSVFINEIHYDNVGTDSGEKVEIAGPAGTDLSGWKIVRYLAHRDGDVPYRDGDPRSVRRLRCRGDHLSDGWASERSERWARPRQRVRNRGPAPELRGSADRFERPRGRHDERRHRRHGERHDAGGVVLATRRHRNRHDLRGLSVERRGAEHVWCLQYRPGLRRRRRAADREPDQPRQWRRRCRARGGHHRRVQ